MDRWDEVIRNMEDGDSSSKNGKRSYSHKSERWNVIEDGNESKSSGKKYNNSSDVWNIPGGEKNSNFPSIDTSVASSRNSVGNDAIFNASGVPILAGNRPANQSSGNRQGANIQDFITFRNFGLIIKFLVMAVILITASFALIAFFTSPAGQLASIIIVVIVFFVMKGKGMLPF